MSEFDNTVILYDEDGEEYEFEIVDRIPYKGKTYDVLWCEDDDSMDVSTQNGDDYETIHDEDVLKYVKKAFSQGLDDLMDEADKFAAESDFMKELKRQQSNTFFFIFFAADTHDHVISQKVQCSHVSGITHFPQIAINF